MRASILLRRLIKFSLRCRRDSRFCLRSVCLVCQVCAILRAVSRARCRMTPAPWSSGPVSRWSLQRWLLRTALRRRAIRGIDGYCSCKFSLTVDFTGLMLNSRHCRSSLHLCSTGWCAFDQCRRGSLWPHRLVEAIRFLLNLQVCQSSFYCGQPTSPILPDASNRFDHS